MQSSLPSARGRALMDGETGAQMDYQFKAIPGGNRRRYSSLRTVVEKSRDQHRRLGVVVLC